MVDKNRPYAQVLEEERTNGLLSATTSYVYGDTLISGTTEGLTHYYHADGMGSSSDTSGREIYDASGILKDGMVMLSSWPYSDRDIFSPPGIKEVQGISP